MLVLNALLGVGTALAPVLVAIFVGLGFWWGLPALSAILLIGADRGQLRAPVARRNRGRAGGDRAQSGIPARFWLFASFAVLYGICETVNGNWSQLDMTRELGASTTVAAIALTAFWAMVTVGRIGVAAVQRWLSTRLAYHALPLLLAASFVIIAVLPEGATGAGSSPSPSRASAVRRCCR